MTLNAKIGRFMVFLAILGCDTSLNIIHKVAPRNYRQAIQIENLVSLFVY